MEQMLLEISVTTAELCTHTGTLEVSSPTPFVFVVSLSNMSDFFSSKTSIYIISSSVSRPPVFLLL
jgi:hypothetical protein